LRRYNPIVAFLGLLIMLAGAVIVFTIFAMRGQTAKTELWIAIGVILTLVGWLLQRLYSGRRARH